MAWHGFSKVGKNIAFWVQKVVENGSKPTFPPTFGPISAGWGPQVPVLPT